MKTALVTGASTGIGRVTAQTLAANGYHVILTARNEEELNNTLKLITQANGSAEIIPADLSQVNSINSLIAKIIQKYTQIDALINVAGIWHGPDQVYAKTDFETFDQPIIIDTINVGTLAPTLLSHALIPYMPEGSSVINISGTFPDGGAGWLPYYVSKRAIEDLTVSLSQELDRKQIKVNCISPSDTATPAYAKYFPEYMPDAISPTEIANMIINMCSSDYTETGQIIVMQKDTDPKEGFHS